MPINDSSTPLQTDAEGIAFLKEREAFRSDAYLDEGGLWTVGYGSLTASPAKKVSEPEALELLLNKVRAIEKEMDKLITVPLTQGQLNAIVSFVYNVGIGAFKRSTLLKKLNAGDVIGVANELSKWVYYTDRKTGEKKKSRGLEARRALEVKLFLGEEIKV